MLAATAGVASSLSASEESTSFPRVLLLGQRNPRLRIRELVRYRCWAGAQWHRGPCGLCGVVYGEEKRARMGVMGERRDVVERKVEMDWG